MNLIQKLNATILEQKREIDRLKEENKRLQYEIDEDYYNEVD